MVGVRLASAYRLESQAAGAPSKDQSPPPGLDGGDVLAKGEGTQVGDELGALQRIVAGARNAAGREAIEAAADADQQIAAIGKLDPVGDVKAAKNAPALVADLRAALYGGSVADEESGGEPRKNDARAARLVATKNRWRIEFFENAAIALLPVCLARRDLPSRAHQPDGLDVGAGQLLHPPVLRQGELGGKLHLILAMSESHRVWS